ncbi:MAG: Trk system potassium transporter TrkA [Acetatifactor sp.]
MKIVIVGVGRTGELLARMLSGRQHELVVVDEREQVVDRMTELYPVSGVCGNGVAGAILQKAGVDTADVVVALTNQDAVNLLCCANAKKMGAGHVVCQVSDAALYQDKELLKRQYGINAIYNPKIETAAAIGRQLGMATDIQVEGFIDQKAAFFQLTVEEKSGLAGCPLKEINTVLGSNLLVACVNRKNRLHVPNGSFVLESGDEIGIIVENDKIHELAYRLGHARKPVKHVMIIGCGEIGYSLVNRLLQEQKKVKILEHDEELSVQLRKELPAEAEIACVNRITPEILEEEGIRKMDACVLLTGDDQTNLVLSMFAWNCGVSTVAAKIDESSYEAVFRKIGIHHIVTPSLVTCELLMTYIRNVEVYNAKGNDIAALFSVGRGLGEAIGFCAYEGSKGIRIPFQDENFRLKKDVLIVAIIRDQKFLVPNGSSMILPGDKVFVVANARDSLRTLDEIFEA